MHFLGILYPLLPASILPPYDDIAEKLFSLIKLKMTDLKCFQMCNHLFNLIFITII